MIEQLANRIFVGSPWAWIGGGVLSAAVAMIVDRAIAGGAMGVPTIIGAVGLMGGTAVALSSVTRRVALKLMPRG